MAPSLTGHGPAQLWTGHSNRASATAKSKEINKGLQVKELIKVKFVPAPALLFPSKHGTHF